MSRDDFEIRLGDIQIGIVVSGISEIDPVSIVFCENHIKDSAFGKAAVAWFTVSVNVVDCSILQEFDFHNNVEYHFGKECQGEFGASCQNRTDTSTLRKSQATTTTRRRRNWSRQKESNPLFQGTSLVRYRYNMPAMVINIQELLFDVNYFQCLCSTIIANYSPIEGYKRPLHPIPVVNQTIADITGFR